MTLDLLTVVTPTMGHSHHHLNRMMMDLRRFTKLPFRQIVCDDGTLFEDHKRRQQEIVYSFGNAIWIENPGPIYGISYNLNHLFESVKTPWVFLVEDGVRASSGWLETAVDAVEKIGLKTWNNCKVGAIGQSHLQEWHLGMAGVLPSDNPWINYLRRDSDTYSAFWGNSEFVNWNDGYWCWSRILPGIIAAACSEDADIWGFPANEVRDYIRGCRDYEDIISRRQTYRRLEATRNVNHPHGFLHSTWPQNRTGLIEWGSSPIALFDMDAWRQCGRWRDGCTFFEGHLGIRMAQQNILWVFCESPPWLHYGSMGFSSPGKSPRHHEPCETDVYTGKGGLLEKDFGCNGPGHFDLFGSGGLCEQYFPLSKKLSINKLIADVDLYMEDGWRKYL